MMLQELPAEKRRAAALRMCASALVCLCLAISLLSHYAETSFVLAASGERHVVQNDSTKLHESPDRSSSVVMELSRGDELLEYRRQGSWIKVGVLGAVGKEGWVEESSLGSGSSLPSPGSSGDGDKKVTGSIGLPAPETKPFSVTFLVEMTGPPARKFRLSCRYITESGRKMRMKRASTVPKSHKLKGKAIRCTMRAAPGVETKRLRMEIIGDGERLGVAYLGYYYSYTLYSPWDWD